MGDMGMMRLTVIIDVASHDNDPEAERDNVEAIRSALLKVADVATEFYPGNTFTRSTLETL